MRLPKLVACIFAPLALAAAQVVAAAPDFSRLGKDLTPIGAERAGNAAGTIPAWDGGLRQPPPGWTPQQGYIDPFPNDKPLFTIDSTNVCPLRSAAEQGPGWRCCRSIRRTSA